MAKCSIFSSRRLRAVSGFTLSLMIFAGCDPALPPTCQVPEAQSPDLARARESGTVTLGASNLPGLLFDGNAAIHIATNRVNMAKLEVAQARADLLPSINLSAMLLSAGQPQFAWAAVEAVVPFLIPGNWFRAGQVKDLFEAERLALQIVEQNQYASAFSLISLWQVDQELLDIVVDDFEETRALRRRIEQAYSLGLTTIDELNRALAADQTAEISVAQVRELLAREEASIRRAFGLKPTTVLQAEAGGFAVPASASESMAIEALIERAMQVAPESHQLDLLEAAARKGRWSAAFAFMGGVGISQQAQDGKLTASLANLSAGGGVQLGFGYFPALRLSSRNIREIQLRRNEMRLEFQEMLQGLQAGLSSTGIQSERFAERERTARSRHEQMKLQVELGLAEPWELVPIEDAWRQARLDSLRSVAEQGLVRLSLQRTLQEGPFATLSPCLAEPDKKAP